MKKPIYLFAILLLVASCTKSVDSDDLKDAVPYYQQYEVAYDKTHNIVNAVATYRVREASGAKVELAGSANVRVNNMPANTSTIDKTRYTWTLNGSPDVDFVLTKNSGETVTNTVLRADIGDVEFGGDFPSAMARTAGFSFSWIGTAISNNEALNVSLTSDQAGEIVTKAVTGNTVTFSPAELKNCPAGNITVALYRVKDIAVKAEDQGAGGTIQLRLNVSRKGVIN